MTAIAPLAEVRPTAARKPVDVVSAAPEWDALLENRNGWIGADCAASVRLDSTSTLWLFDDSFIGRIENGHRTLASPMARNTLAVERGLTPATARVRFWLPRKPVTSNRDGFFVPPDGRGWFWFGDGIVDHGKLWLFVSQIAPAGHGGAFGFTGIGSWLAEVPNYRRPPGEWRVRYYRVPFFRSSEQGEDSGQVKLPGQADGAEQGAVQFGAAICRSGRWISIFGTRDGSKGRRSLLVARVRTGALDQFRQWEFLTGSGWRRDWQSGRKFGDDIGSEMSVSALPGRRGYTLIYSPSTLAPEVRARWAPHPWGPWSNAQVVYTCPDARKHARVFCYAGKAHPELSRPGALLISYATNSFDFGDTIRDASLYFPRFIRVPYSVLSDSWRIPGH